jgi:ABC-type transport system substrate-binding protein
MKRLSFLAALAAVLSSICLDAAEAPRHGGRLVFGLRNDLSTLNPFIRTQSSNFYIRGLVYEALLDYDKDGKQIPALAETWKASNDGKTYAFKLRSGVKFHDGREMTAADVKWSIEYAMNPENRATGLVPLKEVQSVKTTDKLSLEIALKKPDAAFPSTMSSIRPFPVVPKDSVPRAGGKILSAPPGTGPFVL